MTMETIVSYMVYEFDRFCIDPTKRLFLETQTGKSVQIATRAFDLLLEFVFIKERSFIERKHA